MRANRDRPTPNRNLTRCTLIALAFLAIATAVGSAAAEEIVAQGTWTKKGYVVAGGWSIVAGDEGRRIVLDEKFKTRRAPDLKLFLSPRPIDELGDRNATSDSYRIAELEKHSGRQSYAIPDDVDLTAYRTIIIHCEQYSKLWSAAKLEAAD